MTSPVSKPQLPPMPAPEMESKTRYWARRVYETLRDIISYAIGLADDIATRSRTGWAEIDFGSTGITEYTFTVTDADVEATDVVVPRLMYSAPTGKDLDELEFDDFDLMAIAGTGEFTLYARSKYGPVSGKFKIAYTYGAA